jgi:hypothetical protein
MLFGRCEVWQNDADGEHSGNEQSGRHRVIELRIEVVSTASFRGEQELAQTDMNAPRRLRIMKPGTISHRLLF